MCGIGTNIHLQQLGAPRSVDAGEGGDGTCSGYQRAHGGFDLPFGGGVAAQGGQCHSQSGIILYYYWL